MENILHSCPVCSSQDLSLKYESNFKGKRWQDAVPYFLTNRKKVVYGKIAHCSNCSFIFTNPQYSEKEYGLIYQNVEGRKALEKVSEIRYQRLRSRISKFKSHGKILDIGSGDGTFLTNLPNTFDCVGIEPGSHFQNNRWSNGEIIKGTFTQISVMNLGQWTENFDIITAWDLIEHIPDINNFFCLISLLLKKDGILFATLPNADSKIAKLSGKKWNLLLLEHLWYFSPNTLNLIAKKHGLKVCSHRHFPYSVDLRTFALRFFQTYANRFRILSKYFSPKKILHIPIGLMIVSITKE